MQGRYTKESFIAIVQQLQKYIGSHNGGIHLAEFVSRNTQAIVDSTMLRDTLIALHSAYSIAKRYGEQYQQELDALHNCIVATIKTHIGVIKNGDDLNQVLAATTHKQWLISIVEARWRDQEKPAEQTNNKRESSEESEDVRPVKKARAAKKNHAGLFAEKQPQPANEDGIHMRTRSHMGR